MAILAKNTSDGRVVFYCPGCKEHHVINHTWEISGLPDNPTFSPSVLVENGHFAKPDGPCWCTYNAEHPEQKSRFTCIRCHSFIRDGQIEFLSDSSHELAGQTVPMVALVAEVTG